MECGGIKWQSEAGARATCILDSSLRPQHQVRKFITDRFDPHRVTVQKLQSHFNQIRRQHVDIPESRS